MKKVITKEECENSGYHSWNYYKANDVIDEFGVINNSNGRKSGFFLDGETEYRTCNDCKYTEKLEPAKWIEVKNEK